MTSTTNNTPLSHYFAACNEPLLGSDPFLLVVDDAWDADLHPDEYGDQSGVVRHSWDDDNASFTDDSDCSGDDNDDCDNDADDDQSDTDNHHRRRSRQEQWSLVYTASITVVATTTTTNEEEEEKSDKYDSKTTSSSSKDRSPPMNPLLNPHMHRRDSKVRFCEEPPTIVCYEHCSREEYSQLYYSVHELQKIIDEVRMEKTALPPPLVATTKTSGGPPASSVAAAASLAANNRKAADNNNMGMTTTVRTTLRST